MRQEQVYAGPVLVDGEQYYAEIWVQGSTAVVFSKPDNAVRFTLRDIEMSLSADSQLVLLGDDGTSIVQVQAVAAEQHLGTVVGATVSWPGEQQWVGATVTWSQYKVSVALNGDAREYPGATVRAYSREAIIVLPDSSEVHVAMPTRQGCCGAR